MNENGIRRLIQMLLLLALLFCVMGARLAWVQFGWGGSHATGAALSREAVRQRSDGFAIDTGRGQFTDRRGRLWTGVPVRAMVAFPDYGMPRGSADSLLRAAKSLGTTKDELEAWLKELKEPKAWKKPGLSTVAALTEKQAQAIEASGLLGVAVLPYRDRYGSGEDALHAIGYLYEGEKGILSGGTGLEKSMDRLIRGMGPTVVSQLTDAVRRPLGGLGLRTTGPENPNFPLRVRTTLDADMGREVREALRAAGVRQGAAVVLDAADADILAMVSLPRLDPYRIGEQGTDERNHAVTAYPPGSVFKLVTLAAALEAGETTLDQRFRCDGEYGRYGLKCWLHGGHGVLTLEEALAESCNAVFAGLAERLDPAWIQITADRLGLGRQVGWSTEAFADGKPLRLLEQEEPGVIFADKKTASDGDVRAGTGIGQRDVRITPLQAANLVVTLLHGGRVTAPRLVTGIQFAQGGWMAKLPVRRAPSRYGVIQPETAAAVLRAMRSVVTEGTAKHALAGAKWALAGKSGTAEMEGKRKARNDHWFVGYGPADGMPRYAVAILIENQPAGLRNRAASVFGDIMERLRLLELRHPAEGTAAPAGKR